MQLQQIKISEAYESKNNPRGNDFEGKAFDDLVASVKEKGVLVPVIARPMIGGGDKKFEIVAGNRRFRAAQMVGLEEIPARVEDMTDDEAQEVQIIENLQREDVHPIEEGKSYRQLVEESRYEIATIAAKVGKSESYIRQRLFLTNLSEKVAGAYRKGKFTDGHAVLIAKLSPNDQAAALKHISDGWEMPTVKELKEWIETEFYHPLASQPWLKDEKAMEAVGECQECPPNRSSLFGSVKEGSCTDLKCWTRKMGRYIDYKIALAKEQGLDMPKVSKEYGGVSKGVLSKGDYTGLSFKKKDHCDHAQKAIVAEGPDRGTEIWICASAECKKHGKTHSTPYRQTPEEKERRKKEQAKEAAKKEKEDKEILAVLENIQFTQSAQILDILLELVLVRNGEQYTKPVCKRHGWEVVKVESRTWDDKNIRMVSDWEKTIRNNYAELSAEGRLQLIVEIMLETAWEDPKKKIIKMISSQK